MDLEELRLNCLRMAYELGGKPEAIISAANDLLSFVTKGPTTSARESAPEAAGTEGAPSEVSAPAAEPAVTDRIAACGTALEMPDSGDLAHAEPSVEAKTATEAEPAATPEVTEPSEVAAEEAATDAVPTVEAESIEPTASPSPEPVEPLTEATNGGSASPTAGPEVEKPVEAAASASGEVTIPSEEHASVATPVMDDSGQEHTAI